MFDRSARTECEVLAHLSSIVNFQVAQYIGEVCRYLLATSEKNNEIIKHSVKKIVGNGMRPQIWEKFVNKFNIKEVYELYGATEGISNLSK